MTGRPVQTRPLAKEDIFAEGKYSACGGEGKILKIIGEVRYLVCGGEGKRQRKRIDNIRRRKIFCLRRRRRTEKEKD